MVPVWETKGTQGAEYAYAIASIESPTRAIRQLTNLAKGHALSRGRDHITVEDIPMLINVVFSTASIERVRIFELLIAHKGHLTTTQIIKSLNTTHPTAKRTMAELKATGLVSVYPDVAEDGYMYEDDGSKTYVGNVEKSMTLLDKFSWFLSEEFTKLKEQTEEYLLKEICTPQEGNTTIQSCIAG